MNVEENSLLPVVIMICLNAKYKHVHVQNISLCKYNPVKASRSRLYFENMQLVHPTVSHRPPRQSHAAKHTSDDFPETTFL